MTVFRTNVKVTKLMTFMSLERISFKEYAIQNEICMAYSSKVKIMTNFKMKVFATDRQIATYRPKTICPQNPFQGITYFELKLSNPAAAAEVYLPFRKASSALAR